SAALDAHQDTVLVVVARGADRIPHIASRGYRLSGDLENDVAFLEAALGCGALWIDFGNHDTFLAGAGHAVGRRDGQTQLRNIGAAGHAATVAIVIVSLGFDGIRQLAQCEVDDLVLALVQYVELDRCARRNAADRAGEFTSILDRLTIDRRDHVAGFDT